MTDQFDVAVLGMGPGGEVVASRLLSAGKRVAVIERELIGGECAYWACIPSKTLLRPPEVRSEAHRAAGVARPELDWSEMRDYRDWMVRHLDDAKQVDEYQRDGARVVKGTARLAGRTDDGEIVIEVDGVRLQASDVVIATGSEPAVPPVEGLDDVPVWTNREATTLSELPSSALVLGGGAVALELGQFLARMGTGVTVVELHARLLSREEPRVSELAKAALTDDGVGVRLGRTVRRAMPQNGLARVELDDGSTIDCDVVVVATGRRPRTSELDLESVGLELAGDGRLRVDEHCRAGPGLWAVGDVTGQAMFTHVAKYQARVVAVNLSGRPRKARYEGIPRVVFTDPEIAAVGLTAGEAAQANLDVAAVEVDLPAALARPWTHETNPRGTLGLLADRTDGVLVGAWAVAPLASEWIHQAALAVRTRLRLDDLRDQVAQFPTYTEAYLVALEQLDA